MFGAGTRTGADCDTPVSFVFFSFYFFSFPLPHLVGRQKARSFDPRPPSPLLLSSCIFLPITILRILGERPSPRLLSSPPSPPTEYCSRRRKSRPGNSVLEGLTSRARIANALSPCLCVKEDAPDRARIISPACPKNPSESSHSAGGRAREAGKFFLSKESLPSTRGIFLQNIYYSRARGL